jgi:hypothetical protein
MRHLERSALKGQASLSVKDPAAPSKGLRRPFPGVATDGGAIARRIPTFLENDLDTAFRRTAGRG